MAEEAVKMKVWNVGAKVADLDAEVRFIEALGGSKVLDEVVVVDGQEFRLILARWADKYFHLFGKAVYEPQLKGKLPNGVCHVVFEVSDFDLQRRRALDAGAKELMPPQFISAEFGTRDVCFMSSPGGILFELVRVHEHKVPELPGETIQAK